MRNLERVLSGLLLGALGTVAAPVAGSEQVEAYYLLDDNQLFHLRFPAEDVQVAFLLTVPADAIALAPDGRLFAANASGDELLTLDRASGAATPIGSFGRDLAEVVGMTFDEVGRLWLAAREPDGPDLPSLYRADPGTGAVVLVAPLDQPVGGLAAVGEELFAATFRLFRVDTDTGALTALGAGINPDLQNRALSSDGRRIWSWASGPDGIDRLLNAYDPASGELIPGQGTGFFGVVSMTIVPLSSPFPDGRANRVINGTFHDDLLGWDLDDIDLIAWNAVDSRGSEGSGSADLFIQFLEVGGVGMALTQCIPLTGGGQVTAGGRILLPSPGVPGDARIALRFYESPLCTGPAVAQESIVPLTGEDGLEVWHRAELPRVPVPAAARGVEVILGVSNVGFSQMRALFDDVFLVELGPCEPDVATLCIDEQPGDRRFATEIAFATAQAGGRSGLATAVPLAEVGLARGGAFWFFEQVNPEVLLKVLHGCNATGHFWVFYSATTNVGLEVTVIDTLSGEVFFRSNPDGALAVPVADLGTLPCP